MNILFVELVKVFSHFFVLLCEFLIKGVCYWFLSIQAAEIRETNLVMLNMNISEFAFWCLV